MREGKWKGVREEVPPGERPPRPAPPPPKVLPDRVCDGFEGLCGKKIWGDAVGHYLDGELVGITDRDHLGCTQRLSDRVKATRDARRAAEAALRGEPNWKSTPFGQRCLRELEAHERGMRTIADRWGDLRADELLAEDQRSSAPGWPLTMAALALAWVVTLVLYLREVMR